MKLLFTQQALESLQECLDFFPPEVPAARVIEIRDTILAKAHELILHPFMGQEEPYLDHLDLEHRRVVKGNYKIIYRVIDDTVIVTDIFDSRQNPIKMKR